MVKFFFLNYFSFNVSLCCRILRPRPVLPETILYWGRYFSLTLLPIQHAILILDEILLNFITLLSFCEEYYTMFGYLGVYRCTEVISLIKHIHHLFWSLPFCPSPLSFMTLHFFFFSFVFSIQCETIHSFAYYHEIYSFVTLTFIFPCILSSVEGKPSAHLPGKTMVRHITFHKTGDLPKREV